MSFNSAKLGISLQASNDAVSRLLSLVNDLALIDQNVVAVNHNGLSAPVAPTGTASPTGTNAFTYALVGRDGNSTGPDGSTGRRTLQGAVTSPITSAVATLNNNNTITLSWTFGVGGGASLGYSSYDVIRLSVPGGSGNAIGKIGNVAVPANTTPGTSFTFTDNGQVATAYTSPNRNETADVLVSGWVGIGTTTPADQLHVSGSGGTVRFESSGNGIRFSQASSTSYQITNVGANTTLSISPALSISGTATFGNGLTVTNSNVTLNSGFGLSSANVNDNLNISPGGLVALRLSTATGAVNFVQIQSTATTAYPIIAGKGSDSQIGLTFNGVSNGSTGTYLQLYAPSETAHNIASYLAILPATGFGSSTNVQMYVGGATAGLSFRNAGNSADNLLISDAGAVTIRNGLTVSAGNIANTGGDIQNGGSTSGFIRQRFLGSIATNATGAILPWAATGNTPMGMLLVFAEGTTPSLGLFAVGSGAGPATSMIFGSGVFSGSSGTANRFNVYWSASNNRYEYQNLGPAQTFSVVWMGS